MARRYDVELKRTTVETARVVVEAKTEREAAFRAAQLAPEWQPRSTSIDLDKVEYRETIGSEE